MQHQSHISACMLTSMPPYLTLPPSPFQKVTKSSLSTAFNQYKGAHFVYTCKTFGAKYYECAAHTCTQTHTRTHMHVYTYTYACITHAHTPFSTISTHTHTSHAAVFATTPCHGCIGPSLRRGTRRNSSSPVWMGEGHTCVTGTSEATLIRTVLIEHNSQASRTSFQARTEYNII